MAKGKAAVKKASVDMPVDDWQAHSDMETLMQAHQIKSDPKRHAAAKKHAKSKLAAMKKVLGPSDHDNDEGVMTRG